MISTTRATDTSPWQKQSSSSAVEPKDETIKTFFDSAASEFPLYRQAVHFFRRSAAGRPGHDGDRSPPPPVRALSISARRVANLRSGRLAFFLFPAEQDSESNYYI
jgi:hypothetical protein